MRILNLENINLKKFRKLQKNILKVNLKDKLEKLLGCKIPRLSANSPF
jgi:hypothetical protein